MKILLAFLFAALTLAGSTAFAHSSLHKAEPSMGAVLAEAPQNLTLEFSGAVRLINVAITDEEGNPVPLSTSRVMQLQPQFVLPLPTLKAGTYDVEWTIMGSDTHKMSGGYEFTIE